MKKFFADTKKYSNYALFSARSELKAEVAGSFLSWLWWILDPLLHMLIYSFIAVIVFRSREANFPIFVFIGLTVWQFFNKMLRTSVNLVRSNRLIVTKVYIPKYIFLFEKLGVCAFKMLVSFALTAGFMVAYRIPVSWQIIWVIPLILLLFVITFAICIIIMHFGVFVEDLSNIMNVVLQLWFYASGVFFSIEARLGSYSETLAKLMINLNPLALIMNDMRAALLGTGSIHYLAFIVWLFVGIIISLFGISLVYKHENSYVKVI